MADPLEEARRRANSVRFAGEKENRVLNSSDRATIANQRPLRKALDITKSVTPELYDVVATVCAKLSVSMESVRARVYPSEELQAHCSLWGGGCLIEVTSSLVEHLDSHEQAFVIGHELGHFLLDHHFLDLPEAQSTARFQKLRAREISADRIGLIATTSPEAAMRAIMKSFSGLSEKRLRFDAASFLRHAFNTENVHELAASKWDTHPSFAVRARCLVHFMPLRDRTLGERWIVEFNKIEQRVLRDIERYSEIAVQRYQTKTLENCREWIWVSAAIEGGKISAKSMSVLEEDLNADFVEKVRANFSEMRAFDVDDIVSSNLVSAINKYCESGSDSEVRDVVELCETVERRFNLNQASNAARKICESFEI
ncbi:M48 family metalloprotease [Hyphomonas sp.]|jgi:hypothetical protein|uniref:M48 family metalloprotease n=1 Tax=Hyphomonas sp. TaxID=87 RepID=UPI000E051781|nr:M48 family metalloprotease [Hyphomonas sp.]RCL87352.1 MAG: ImmA/IrrE family metallo-endopeptidase [Hyphomonas sp.]